MYDKRSKSGCPTREWARSGQVDPRTITSQTNPGQRYKCGTNAKRAPFRRTGDATSERYNLLDSKEGLLLQKETLRIWAD